MPIIYSYPTINTVKNTDLFVISQSPSDPSVDEWETKSVTADSLGTYITARVNLNFDADTGNAVVNLDTQSLSIEGTANEIETVATQGNSRGILTIGLPDSVTITNNLTIGGDFVGANGAFTNDLFVGNNLTATDILAQGTLSVVGQSSMTDNLNMNLNNINNVADPLLPQDAATKSYVDGLVTGGLIFRGSFNASTGQIVSGANTGSYLYNCPGGAGARVAIAVGDYYIVANQGGQFYCSGDLLNVGDSIIAVADAIADSSTINDWSTVESDNVEGTGINGKIPLWTGSQTLSVSNINQDIISGNISVSTPTTINSTLTVSDAVNIDNATSSSSGIIFTHPAGGASGIVNMYYNGATAGSRFVISRSATGGPEIELQSDGDINLNRTGNGKVLIGNTLEVSGDIEPGSDIIMGGGEIFMNGGSIKQLNAPTVGSDAATKSYVDSAVQNSPFLMNGLVNNLASAASGGYDFMEWVSNITSSTQIPVMKVPFDLTLRAVTYSWMGDSALSIGPGEQVAFTIGVIPSGVNPVIANYTAEANLFTLDNTDDGTYANGIVSGINQGFGIGDVIAVVGQETGTVTPNSGELSLCFHWTVD